MEMANTLAYYDTATNTAVKCFIVQSPGCVKNEQYYVNRAVVNGNELYISFIIVNYKHYP